MTLGVPLALPSPLPSRRGASITLSDTLVLKAADFRGGGWDLSAPVLELTRTAGVEGRRNGAVCQDKSSPRDAAGIQGSGLGGGGN